MLKRVEFQESAVREAAQAFLWYAGQSEAAAAGFAAELREALALVSERPGSFPNYLAGTRRCMVRNYPYLVVFRELSEVVQVIAVAHGHRKPGFWRRRAP